MPRKRRVEPPTPGSEPVLPNPLTCTRIEYLEDALVHYETLAEQASSAESWVAAVKAKDRAIELRAELDQLRETSKRLDQAPSTIEEHKAEIRSEARRLRQGATEAGSYVAAANLLKLEGELLAQAEAEAQAEKRRRMEHIDEKGLVGTLREAIGRLPEDVQRELLQGLVEDISDPVH
jgi:hypothetical protein